MAKKLIKMNESDLKRIIDRIISEREMNAVVGMGSGFVNDMKEDSEGEETYNYGEDEGEDHDEEMDLEHDEDMAPHDRVDAIQKHLDALKKDMSYDEDREDRGEDGDDFE